MAGNKKRRRYIEKTSETNNLFPKYTLYNQYEIFVREFERIFAQD